MARRPLEDTYVEDSEEEDMMESFSVIQTADGMSSRVPLGRDLSRRDDTSASSIQTANFTDVRVATVNVPSPANVNVSVVSDISTFTPVPKPPPSSKPVPTSKSTAYSSISTESSSAAKPRPRPRPAFKRKDGAAAASDPSLSSIQPASDLSFAKPAAPSPIQTSSDTATSSSKAPSKKRVSDSGVDLSDIQLGYTQGVAEAAKTRTRKAKAKQPMPGPWDVIDLSSDDELLIPPKPRKAPAAKRQKTAHLPSESILDFGSEVDTIPIPTSSLPAGSSQLPPSDPIPPPVASPTRPVYGYGSPLSSPSPPMPPARVRRPPAPPITLDDDVPGLNLPPALPVTVNVVPDSQPPPASLVSVPAVARQPSSEGSKSKGKRKADESDGFDSLYEVPAKPKGKKKRAADDDEEEWGAPKPAKSRKKARVEEDDDDAWTGDGPSASKAKKPPRAKKDKAKKDKDPAAKPAKPRRASAKAKAKEKQPTSAEFVEDSDAEADASAMPPPPVPTGRAATGDTSSEATASSPSKTTDAPSANNGSTDPPSEVSATTSVKSGASSTSAKKSKGKQKAKAIVLSDDEDEAHAADISTNTVGSAFDSPSKEPTVDDEENDEKESAKENTHPAPMTSSVVPPHTPSAARKPFKAPTPATGSKIGVTNRSYSIASGKSTPMSELIRKVNSHPSSPFAASPRPTYSPLVKTSKNFLRKIAPLHPNRRTPPPPPPRPPPPKKTKKQLELEEKWEMELEDTVEGWYAMSEEERAALKRAKRDMEMGFED